MAGGADYATTSTLEDVVSDPVSGASADVRHEVGGRRRWLVVSGGDRYGAFPSREAALAKARQVLVSRRGRRAE